MIDSSPEFLRTGTTEEVFQQLGKQAVVRYLLQSLERTGNSSFLRDSVESQDIPAESRVEFEENLRAKKFALSLNVDTSN